MNGTLKINSVTYNKVNVTWTLTNSWNDGYFYTSPPFSIPAVGHAAIFTISATRSQILSVTIKKNPIDVGRATITLNIECEGYINTARMTLQEKWQRDCTFGSIGPLPPNTAPKSLLITCYITWFGFAKEDENSVGPLPWIITYPVFGNNSISDVQLIVEDKELSAYKTILALHSPVFLAMFETPMKESKENRVVIEDIEFTTMETLLRIICTGEIKELSNTDTALKILSAAEKYQMLSVKRACEYKLQMKVAADNVLMLLEEGDKYNAIELIQTCINYIIATREKIISMKDFKKMCGQRPNLAMALVQVEMDKLYLMPYQG